MVAENGSQRGSSAPAVARHARDVGDPATFHALPRCVRAWRSGRRPEVIDRALAAAWRMAVSPGRMIHRDSPLLPGGAPVA